MIKHITVEEYFDADPDKRPDVTYQGKKVLNVKYESFSQDIKYRLEVESTSIDPVTKLHNIEEEGFLLPITKLNIVQK